LTQERDLAPRHRSRIGGNNDNKSKNEVRDWTGFAIFCKEGVRMTTTTKPEIYQFRDCEIDTVERFLKKNGKRVELTTREFDTLMCLVENAGRIVTHDEMLNCVWGVNNLNVEQSNLPVQVSRIRKALGEARTERYIETVHGMGYRLLARVQVLPF